MSSAAEEVDRSVAVFERIEMLDDVAQRVDERDRTRLELVVRSELELCPAVRPVAAAKILDLSEKTVRNWVDAGILKAAETASPRLLIDANVLHDVSRVVKEIRAAGETRTLLDEVFRRLVDATWLERGDLAESLDQMGRGDVVVRVPRAE